MRSDFTLAVVLTVEFIKPLNTINLLKIKQNLNVQIYCKDIYNCIQMRTEIEHFGLS